MANQLLSLTEARELVLRVAGGRLGVEQVEIERALDRVLAADLIALGDVPPFACSAMDGYAVHTGPAGRALRIAGEARAGAPADVEVQPGAAIRISTGAVVPAGASAVIRQEEVTVREDAIVTDSAVAAGANIRRAGEDLRAGQVVLLDGARLHAGALASAVSAGAAMVPVARRPVVAILCTGDELRAPGATLRPGQIHNSNGVLLRALASRGGALAGPEVRLPDDREATAVALASALEQADVLVLTGGVSVGPHDQVRPALAALDVEQHFWGVALQPGKPVWFGSRGRRLVFGLPGNPVSAAITFALFVDPALEALQGARPVGGHPREAVLGAAVTRRADRDRVVAVALELDARGVRALETGPQDSHQGSSLIGADALAVVPRGEGELPAGTVVALERWPR